MSLFPIEPILFAYGVQFGNKGMQNVSRARAVQYRRPGVPAFLFFIFGVKNS